MHGLSRCLRFACLLLASFGSWLPQAGAATLINLDSTTGYTNGPLANWTNNGTVSGDFTMDTTAPIVVHVDGIACVQFFGGASCVGPVAPASVCSNAPRTFEAWIWDPSRQARKTIFAWGRRLGSLNEGLEHGSDPISGCAVQGGEPFDLGYGAAANVVTGAWTYVVFTYDGNGDKVYVDGTLRNQESGINLSTAQVAADNVTPLRFRVARQNLNANGDPSSADLGDFYAARFRVKDSVMTAAEVLAQFDAEKGDLGYKDSDGDEMPDWFEARYSLNPNLPADAAFDPDSDGLTNLQESQAGSNPLVADTDGDGVGDGNELNRVDPQTSLPAPTNPTEFDTDDDGLSDGAETDTGTFVSVNNTGSDPLRADTDADTWSDGFEVAHGTDPNTIGPIPDPLFLPGVNLNATTLPAGPLATWTNTGTLAGNFAVPTNAVVPSVVTVDGVNGIRFLSSRDFGGTHYLGPEVPPALTGAGERTVEMWIHNPSLYPEESALAWGRRQGFDSSGKNFSFGHGYSPNFGALSAWGNPDTGWNGRQVTNRWTQIVVTYDGSTVHVFSDGELANNNVVALNTAAFAATAPNSPTDTTNRLHFRLARQNTDTGVVDETTTYGDFTIATVVVFDFALDAATIQARFNSQKALFNLNDSDSDGMPDWYEARWGLNKNDDAGPNGANGDPDGDELTNLQEFQLGTAATLADTDGDGVSDGTELNRIDPQTGSPAPTDPLRQDTDSDGLSDGVETDTGVLICWFNTGSDPLSPDTDGDGFFDYQEVYEGTDPSDPQSFTYTISEFPVTPACPVVDLDAIQLAAGPLNTWSNKGGISPLPWVPPGQLGDFVVPTNATAPPVVSVNGVNAVAFITAGGAGGGTHYLGPEVPDLLTGTNSRTIEAWVYDASAQSEQTVFAWGRRGGDSPDGRNFAFGHGTNSGSGAMDVWGPANMGWGDRTILGRWTYLAVTHHGGNTCAYVDGQLVNNQTNLINTAAFAADVPGSPLDTTNRLHFRIARQNNDTGGIDDSGWGIFNLARLRVSRHAVSAPDILRRFNAEKQLFASPMKLEIAAVDTLNNAITLTWTAPPVQSLTLETSSNLLDWTVTASNLNVNLYTDSLTNSVSERKFYRLKSP